MATTLDLTSPLAPLLTRFTRSLLGGSPTGNGSRIHPGLRLDHWPAVSDGEHNLTTDLTHWRDQFFLVHSSSPWHIASRRSKLVIWRSPDARQWKKVIEFTAPGGDIRDPKFGIIGDRLFLFFLRNQGVVAEPCDTSYSFTEDGERWSPPEEASPKGWLFWRPKTNDGKTWYLPAYWHQHGKSLLLKTTDGNSLGRGVGDP